MPQSLPIASIAPSEPGDWRAQVDSLLTPIERRLVRKRGELAAELESVDRNLAALRATKRQAGVITEVAG